MTHPPEKPEMPERYWIRPNVPYKENALFCGTDAEYAQVLLSCRDGIFPYVPASRVEELEKEVGCLKEQASTVIGGLEANCAALSAKCDRLLDENARLMDAVEHYAGNGGKLARDLLELLARERIARAALSEPAGGAG